MIRINLLGGEAEKQSKGFRSLRIPELTVGMTQAGMAALFILVLTGIGAAWFMQSRGLSALRTELASVQAERARLQEIADQVRRLQDRADLMQRKLEVIVDLKANQTGPVMLLDQISRLLVDGIWLGRLQLDDGAVEINGSAMSENNVADFVNNLESSEYFKNVRLRTLGDSGDSQDFYISLDFQPTMAVQVPVQVPAGGGGGD
jgi:type IV pilus assembly protein PilN